MTLMRLNPRHLSLESSTLPLSSPQKLVFKTNYHLMQVKMYCRMLQGEHSAILLTFIQLPFVMFIFEWPFYTGFTVLPFLRTYILSSFFYFLFFSDLYQGYFGSEILGYCFTAIDSVCQIFKTLCRELHLFINLSEKIYTLSIICYHFGIFSTITLFSIVDPSALHGRQVHLQIQVWLASFTS